MSRTTWQVHKFHREIIPKHVPNLSLRLRVTATRVTLAVEIIIFLPQALDQQHEFRSKVLSVVLQLLVYSTKYVFTFSLASFSFFTELFSPLSSANNFSRVRKPQSPARIQKPI